MWLPAPLLPGVILLRGQTYLLGNKTADAENEFLKVLQLDPNHLEAAVTLARLCAVGMRWRKPRGDWFDIIGLT